MQISSGAIGNGLYQKEKGNKRNLGSAYPLKNLFRDLERACRYLLVSLNQCVNALRINMQCRLMCLAPSFENTPLVEAEVCHLVDCHPACPPGFCKEQVGQGM